MKQYEYKIINTRGSGVPTAIPAKRRVTAIGEHFAAFEAGLNRLGRDGWALCNINHDGWLLIFRREKPPR